MFKDFTGTFPTIDPRPTLDYPALTYQRKPILFLPAGDTERVLKLARELVRRGWARGSYATTILDIPISHTHSYAYNFCAMGALMRATDDYPVPRLFGKYWREYRYQKTLRVLASAVGADMKNFDADATVMRWNDNSSQTGVLAGFDTAVNLAKHNGERHAWF